MMIVHKFWQTPGSFLSRIGLTFLILCLLSAAHSQDQVNKQKGIIFTTKRWQDVEKFAKDQHKQIFVDAYAAWCVPCKQMQEQTFKDQRVAAYFNQRFINVSIDIEKGEGKMLGEKFEITAYPTLLLVDENGVVIARSEGFIGPEQLLALFKKEEKIQ